jgi:hypothetical protein
MNSAARAMKPAQVGPLSSARISGRSDGCGHRRRSGRGVAVAVAVADLASLLGRRSSPSGSRGHASRRRPGILPMFFTSTWTSSPGCTRSYRRAVLVDERITSPVSRSIDTTGAYRGGAATGSRCAPAHRVRDRVSRACGDADDGAATIRSSISGSPSSAASSSSSPCSAGPRTIHRRPR